MSVSCQKRKCLGTCKNSRAKANAVPAFPQRREQASQRFNVALIGSYEERTLIWSDLLAGGFCRSANFLEKSSPNLAVKTWQYPIVWMSGDRHSADHALAVTRSFWAGSSFRSVASISIE